MKSTRDRHASDRVSRLVRPVDRLLPRSKAHALCCRESLLVLLVLSLCLFQGTMRPGNASERPVLCTPEHLPVLVQLRVGCREDAEEIAAGRGRERDARMVSWPGLPHRPRWQPRPEDG